ncbi:MAG: TAXI family TRAP transporter solute-binding subunit [Thermoanaerobacteraceae bacterium]|nr:TAXI family TRAP transporter solute-binding subunit [Thermoanaerobacteraceae bacterium]
MKIKTKRISLLVLMIVFALVFAAGCGGGPRAGGNDQAGTGGEGKLQLTIATGGTGGPYHTIATGLADIWNKNLDNVNVTVASTGASVINNRMVDSGQAELAFAMSDVSYYGKEGSNMFEEPLKNVRGFASAHTNFVQLVTTKDSGINSVEDLRGKRVGVGAPGSGTELNARRILAAYGITYDDLAKADYLSYAETAEQLSNRNIDAGFFTGGLPIASITELATKQDIKIIPIEPEIVEKLKQEFPVYMSKSIPAGTYKGVDEPVNTLALKNYILVNKDLDEQIVYDLVKTMFENLDELYGYHNAAKQIKLETALEAMELELHPGVAKYYQEQGIEKQ